MKGEQTKISVRFQDAINKNEGQLRDHYRIGKVLGQGAFGEVRLCVHRDTQAQRAVKVLRKSTMDEDQRKMFFNEINILKELDHPNIVKMYEFFEDEKRWYIVQEICKGGELFDEILQRGKFAERDAALLIKAILGCINYCHLNNIIHRDLKPENILLEQTMQFDQIKIIDFGTALVYEKGTVVEEKLGTPYYIAPEVLNKNYGPKCDIWSLGVISYILLCGAPPFSGATDNEIMKSVRVGKTTFSTSLWKGIDPQAKDFVDKLLTYDQNQRPDAKACLNHPWIQKIAKTELDANQAIGALQNLTSFRADSTMKMVTYAYIASQLLSKTKKEELAKIFKVFDKNCDGRLDHEEVKQGYLEHYGKVMTDEEVQFMFKCVDADNSGYIDYTEFVVATMNESEMGTNEFLKAAFKMFDKDGSGIISADEIAAVLGNGATPMEPGVIDHIIKQVDKNGDGEIEFEEFAAMMKEI